MNFPAVLSLLCLLITFLDPIHGCIANTQELTPSQTPEPISQVLLLTGAPRSGTDWVGSVLSFPLGVQFPQLARTFPCFGCIREPFNPDTEPLYVCGQRSKDLCGTPFSRQYEWMNPQTQDLLSKTRWLDNSIHLCTENILKSDPPVLLKDPIALLSAEWLYQRYGTKVLVLTRHPVSWVASMKKANFWGIPGCERSKVCQRRDFIDMFFENQGSLVKHFQLQPLVEDLLKMNQSSLLDQTIIASKVFFSVMSFYEEKYGNDPNWRFVRWEDLAQNPIQEFEALFDWLGIEYDDRLKGVVATTSQAPPESGRGGDRHHPFRNSQRELHDWVEDLSFEEGMKVWKETEKYTSKFYSPFTKWGKLLFGNP